MNYYWKEVSERGITKFILICITKHDRHIFDTYEELYDYCKTNNISAKVA
jgi:hypothetical protein